MYLNISAEKALTLLFIDDLGILDMINMLLHPTILRSMSPLMFQQMDTMNRLCEWTSTNKMELNMKKSDEMEFNFTKEFQFNSIAHLLWRIPRLGPCGEECSQDHTAN
jgi:hypothetical protein